MTIANQISDEVEFAAVAKHVFAADESLPPPISVLGPDLLAEFTRAELERRLTEDRWLKDLRQYRGIYDPEILSKIGPVRSKAFVRKTRVKVKTVDSRVADLLFPAGAEKNWSVEPTPKPTLSDEQKAQIIQQLEVVAAQAQQAAEQAGQGAAPIQLTEEVVNQAVKEVAKKAAAEMSKTIDDQLTEARYKEVCVKAIHSGHLYGTGIIKGPLVERKVRTSFVKEDGRWVTRSEAYLVPFVDYVPLWRFFPDMAASTLEDCRYVYERHLFTASDMADLAERRSFNRQAIVEYLKTHPQGEIRTRYVDNELKVIGDRQANQGSAAGQFEVLERWGWLRGEQLKQVGIDVPDDRVHESFFSNVWLLPNGEIIKAVLQPINGVTWPYHIYAFDKDETSLFGEGLASIMRDDQTMLNAAVRLMLDNAAITSGSMLEVTPTLLSQYDSIDEVAPWKVWVRNNQNPGAPAVRSIDLKSNLPDLTAMANMFEANTDEVTAIPRYMTGENATNGAAATSSGMSMLMGAANIVIKDLVTSWDEGVTRTFLQAMYRWNMQFNPDNAIKGDFDVKARGTASLVAKEVRGRQLNEFAAMTANPMDAPYIKRDVLNRQRAEANELGDVVKTEDEVKAEQANGPLAQQAQFQAQMQQIQLATAAAQLAKVEADAQLTAAKTALAKVEAIDRKVEAIYAALQAGGVAVQSPHVAPAGDEILRSAGFEDETPDPAISQLMQQRVQGGAQAPMGAMNPNPGNPAPATGHVGERQGIETVGID